MRRSEQADYAARPASRRSTLPSTANNTRGMEQKKALFSRTAQLLGESPGLRPEDVFINIVEVAKENWSFGHGLAQYA